MYKRQYVEDLPEDHQSTYDKEIGKSCRESGQKHVCQKVAFNYVFVRFQRQEKGGNTDGKHTDQGDLRRYQRVGLSLIHIYQAWSRSESSAGSYPGT